MDRGAWRATVYGGGRVGHNLVTKKQNNMKIWAANSKVEIWVCDELVLSLNIGLEKEINLKYSLKGVMLKLKLRSFGHLM